MASEFEAALAFVLENEKGYEDNPNDPGGATNLGLSLRFLHSLSHERLKFYGFPDPEIIDAEFVKALTPAKVAPVYRYEFWMKTSFGLIMLQPICDYVFDMAVQHGVNQGVKLLQRAMWAAAMQKDIIQDDGLLGHETLLKLNSQTNQAMLLPALMAERAGYVRMLAAKYPTDGRFLNGWLNRCYRI